MPLVSCPDCYAEVSDMAPTCPRCGRPMRWQQPPQWQPPQYGPPGVVRVREVTSPVTMGCAFLVGVPLALAILSGFYEACTR